MTVTRLDKHRRKTDSDTGCAYCGFPGFKTIRIDRDDGARIVTAVNWCPECGREDWVDIDPVRLACAVVDVNAAGKELYIEKIKKLSMEVLRLQNENRRLKRQTT